MFAQIESIHMEGAALLDLSTLEPHFRPEILKSRYKKQAIYQRKFDFAVLMGLIVGVVALGFRYLITDVNQLANASLWLFTTILFFLKLRVSYQITSSDRGLSIPYTWITRILIPWKNIVSITQENLVDIESNEDHFTIQLGIDIPKLRYNTTGLLDSNILLTETEYDRGDLERFYNEIRKKKQELAGTPNTQAQRLTDQINRSWDGRWKLVLLNLLDPGTELIFTLLVIDVLVRGLFGATIWPVFGIVIIALLVVPLAIYHIFNRPTAIIGIRAHELGPLIYNEEEVLTTIRVILMCKPHNVKIIGFELLFPEGHEITQVHTLKQLHPEIIEKGELTYVVAQFLGNHTKARGTTVKFEYETNRKNADSFEIPVYWN